MKPTVTTLWSMWQWVNGKVGVYKRGLIIINADSGGERSVGRCNWLLVSLLQHNLCLSSPAGIQDLFKAQGISK